jgi:glycosyltransferase involved in cell wall biosynthesis
VDEANGYIIEKRNAAAIRDAAVRFLETPAAARRRMSEASIEKVKQRFTWQAVAERHLALFRELAPSHG